MNQSRVFAEGEEVNEGLVFRARVVRRYVSHVLSFPQMLSNAPSKAGLNMQYYTPWRQCSAFCHSIHDIVQDDKESRNNQQELASTAANPPSPQESCCGQGPDD
jgi:hypothetical protein